MTLHSAASGASDSSPLLSAAQQNGGAEHKADPSLRVADPRVRRTRELLQQALATLLHTHDFEKLSVQAITAAAGLNRATFYAHYPDKFALLECMVADHFLSLLSNRGVVFDASCAGALEGIVLGVCDYLAEILDPTGEIDGDRQLAPNPYGQNQLAPHLESAIAVVVRHTLLEGLKRHPLPGGDPPEILAATASWAIYGAAREWVSMRKRPTSEEISGAIVRLVAPILAIGIPAASGAAETGAVLL